MANDCLRVQSLLSGFQVFEVDAYFEEFHARYSSFSGPKLAEKFTELYAIESRRARLFLAELTAYGEMEAQFPYPRALARDLLVFCVFDRKFLHLVSLLSLFGRRQSADRLARSLACQGLRGLSRPEPERAAPSTAGCRRAPRQGAFLVFPAVPVARPDRPDRGARYARVPSPPRRGPRKSLPSAIND